MQYLLTASGFEVCAADVRGSSVSNHHRWLNLLCRKRVSMENKFTQVKVDIIKNEGINHIHLVEFVDYDGQDQIAVSPKSQIAKRDVVYINNIKFCVEGGLSERTKNIYRLKRL